MKVGSTGFKIVVCAREEEYEFGAISDKNSALCRMRTHLNRSYIGTSLQETRVV